jgi:hypothetical protein
VGNTAEYDLAWELASAVDTALSAADRSVVFAKIGAGDTYGAIGLLLSSAQHRGAPIGPDLLRRVTAWLTAYAGCAEEPRLRDLLTRLEPTG